MNVTAMQPYPQGVVVPMPSARRKLTPDQVALIQALRNPEYWTMSDTVIISPSTAATPGGNSPIAFANFANVTNNIPMFTVRTTGACGFAVTSMTTTSGYVDWPYKSYGMGADVWCSTDAPAGAASQFTARQFVETMIYDCAAILTFATDTKLAIPLVDIPAGGGAWSTVSTDARAPGANQTAAGAVNGFPGVQARVLFKLPILFRAKETPFSVSLQLSAVGLARLNALQPLTGNFEAGVRIKFWGYRGKALVSGSQIQPGDL